MKYQELHKELKKWKEEGIISEEQYSTLDERYKPKKVFIPRIHKQISLQRILWFFGIAIVILGTLAWIGQVVPVVNDFVVFSSLAMTVVAMLFLGDYVAGRPTRVLRYTGKGIIVLACILTTFIIIYADIKSFNKFGVQLLGSNWTLFLIISSVILLPIAYKMREKVVLGYSLALFLMWFISQGQVGSGDYASTWLYMTLPTRMLLLSLVFLGIGYIHKKKVLEKFDPSEKYDNLSKTYTIFGLLIMFIPAWMASMGKWLVNPILPMKMEIIIFVILVMALSIYSIYLGIVKNNKVFLNFGLTFFVLEALGKVHQTLSTSVKPVYYIGMIMVLVIMIGMVEYVITHKDEIKKELKEK